MEKYWTNALSENVAEKTSETEIEGLKIKKGSGRSDLADAANDLIAVSWASCGQELVRSCCPLRLHMFAAISHSAVLAAGSFETWVGFCIK